MGYDHMKQRFRMADPKFGPVPFWWWSAEEVTPERIRWQLQKFRAGGLRNIGIINIAPTGPQYGSEPDNPAYFSERWWQMFEVALREAERLGMTLYIYDQIGFSGSNFPARIVAEHPEYAGYVLRRYEQQEALPDGAELLYTDQMYRYAAVRQGFNWLDPGACAMLLDRVHGEFERRFGADLGRTIGGTFQDELPPLNLWTAQMPQLYKARFGEDLIPMIPALFAEMPGAELVRRRVYKLAAELAEQSFFIPIARWHDKYDLLLCCDQAGPARRVELHGAQRLYLDYFRTHRWYNASGCDMDGEIKHHASMAHLNGGKRVFLEAFHTSGWGGTLEETMHWLVPWFQAGATMYSAHAVYFSTRGGWWEWAPPDTGWRQPYYEHYEVFANTVSRVSALLSEGNHVADIAVHYPSAAAASYMTLADGRPNEHPMAVASRTPNERLAHIQDVHLRLTGRWSRKDQTNLGVLRDAGYDYDVVDDTALERGIWESPDTGALDKAIKHGPLPLQIANEQFSAVLLSGTAIMDEAARDRLQAWAAQGGLVVGVAVPEEEQAALSGVQYVATAEDALALIQRHVALRIAGGGMSLMRRTSDADIFLLLPDQGQLLRSHQPASTKTKLQDSTVYRLRTAGIPQLWDPVSGQTRDLQYRRADDWIEVEASFTDWPAALIVCRTNDALVESEASQGEVDDLPLQSESVRHTVGLVPAQVPAWPQTSDARSLQLLDTWRVQPVSTLDNRYGDFDLHSRAAYVPIERRHYRVQMERTVTQGESAGWHLPACDDQLWDERLWSEACYWKASAGQQFDESSSWSVVYSQTLGDHAFRTWAGRMGRVPRRFLNLGHAHKDTYVTAQTHVLVPEAGRYWVRVESNARLTGEIGGKTIEWHGGPEEMTAFVELEAGPQLLVLQAQAIVDGLIRIGIEVNSQARDTLPKWIYSATPNPQTRLLRQVHSDPAQKVRRVRMVFAGRGRVSLYVNGSKVTEHGDFNPYIRQGQELVDITHLWLPGNNEVVFVMPEGEGVVLADGIVEYSNGDSLIYCTGEDWLDESGGNTQILHEAVLQFAETETLWLTFRPHPLSNVEWLQPACKPDIAPLGFHYDPASIGQPIWLRFELPVGTCSLTVDCHGTATLWMDGQQVELDGGRAICAPQAAGTIAALRIEPDGPYTDADVLRQPIRFETVPVAGALGDWRTVLSLPHHSGAVEYETEIVIDEPGCYALDLGHVRGTAEAWLDGKPLGVRLWRPYRYATAQLPAGRSRLRVRVTNTLGAHYEIGRPSYNVGASTDPKVSYWAKPGDIDPAWQKEFASGGMYGPVQWCKRENSASLNE